MDLELSKARNRRHAVEHADKKTVAEWIAMGLAKPGKTQTGLANALGITQPQIVRLLSGERSLRAEEISRVESYLDEPFPYATLSVLQGGETHDMAGQMPVLFRVQAGAWMEADSVVDDILAHIPFARDPTYPRSRRQFAVKVVGDSMDRVLPDGCFAIVVEADGQQPVHGDLVIVRRSRAGLVERTVKRYLEDPDGAVLAPESSNAKHVRLPVAGGDDTTIEIEGFVIGRFERLGR